MNDPVNYDSYTVTYCCSTDHDLRRHVTYTVMYGCSDRPSTTSSRTDATTDHPLHRHVLMLRQIMTYIVMYGYSNIQRHIRLLRHIYIVTYGFCDISWATPSRTYSVTQHDLHRHVRIARHIMTYSITYGCSDRSCYTHSLFARKSCAHAIGQSDVLIKTASLTRVIFGRSTAFFRA